MKKGINALVIDDEQHARLLIMELLKDYAPNINILGEAASLEAAIKQIRAGKPDLVFLDMNLNGDNGFKVLEYFGENPGFKTIITTAYEQFALESYNFEIVDYLLKPITPGRFKKAISKFETRKNPLPEKEIPGNKKPEIRIYTRLGLKYIEVEKIVRLQAERNYSWMYFNQANPVLLSKTLSLMEDELLPHGFLRPHHTHLINPVYVQSFDKQANRLLLRDTTALPVSRDRKKEIVEFLARYQKALNN